MRNSILGVLGEMISHVLSGEELDSKQKSTRDQFLDKLEVLVFFWHKFFVFLSLWITFHSTFEIIASLKTK